MNDKKEQRKAIKERLSHMIKEERKEFSARIADKLLSHPFYLQARRLFIYCSTEEEADTHFIIERALSEGKSVFLPRIEGGNMAPVPYRAGDTLKKGVYGIEEPQGAPYFGEIDLAVIPLLGYDASRARLGRGKGYYDRFLSSFKGKSIALAFSVQALPKVEVERTDVRPDLILTEKEEI
ncbi:MAG: 5-formyltetrahydrofolate cyclo-ligase [Clostridia bacterium]|nr:5-formyltetrahydrofolate cyclo-ligase [Clostridia bacterium]